MQAVPGSRHGLTLQVWASVELAARQHEIAELLVTNRPSSVWKQLHDEAGLQASLASFRRYVLSTFPESYARRPGATAPREGPQAGEPGAYAQQWVATLAESRGGYGALAKAAGFNEGWPIAIRRGSVPRARTVLRLTQALALPEGDTRAVLDDITAFWSRVQAPRMRRVRCRVCQREVSLSHARSTGAYDPTTQDWAHSTCAGRVAVECPDCHTHRTLIRSRLDVLVTHEVRGDQHFAQCRSCAARANAADMRDDQLQRLIESRLEWIERNSPETSGDRLLAAWYEQHRDQQQPAQFLKRHRRDRVHQQLIAALRADALLRSLGASPPARGRLAARGPSRTKARAHVAMGKLSGVFGLCPLCGLLVYRKTASHERFGQGWHPPCFDAWRRLPPYREWSGRRLLAARRGGQQRQSSNFPIPPAPTRRGRPVTSVSLADGYRALAQQGMGGVGPGKIAAHEGVTEPAIVQRVARIRAYLPASWDLVFGQAAKGNPTRQELFPLPQIHDGQRAATERMRGLGVAPEVIEQVTGVRLPE